MAGGAKVSLSMGVQVGMGSLSLVPVVGRDGKDKKYLTRLAQVSDYSACTPDEDYYKKIVDDVSIRVLLGKAQKKSGLDSVLSVYWLYRRLDGASR